MPRVTDLSRIREILETDRNWAVYALGDLAPGSFENCVWHCSMTTPAIALLYCGFETPVLLALGKPPDVEPLLRELGSIPKMYLHVRPEILDVLRASHDIVHEKTMVRMILDPQRFKPAATQDVVRLTLTHRQALEGLYADGEPTGEAPEFFLPWMLENGVYFGIAEEADLIAAAGTHLVVPQESVAAIGCVYTKRDHRHRGLATRATSAVVAELLRMNLQTIALNVNVSNTTASRIYEKLGFYNYCTFKEGLAVGRDTCVAS
jgi:ribosomal protein S18 acetylase RimI-like enzyme